MYDFDKLLEALKKLSPEQQKELASQLLGKLSPKQMQEFEKLKKQNNIK